MQGSRAADHPSLMVMFAARTTFSHLSISDATYAPNSSGVNTLGVVAPSGRRFLTTGSTRPALISRLSRAMMSGGVPRATPTPHHEFATYSGSVSLMDGTSGRPE